MKKIFLLIFSSLLIAIFFIAPSGSRLGISSARANHKPCPAGTVPVQGHKCLQLLTGDMTLSSTIVIDSRMILDCQGYTLSPSVAGTVDDATTPANEFTPSEPDLAIFLNNTVDAKVQNCIIGDVGAKFDFGVYALNSDNNAIKHNIINVRTVGVHFLNSSHNKLSENEITYGSELGRGVHLDGDTDFNIVEGNHVTSTGDDGTGFVKAEPGTYFPIPTAGGVDVAIYSGGLFYTLLNLSINGEVFQVPRVVVETPEGNTMDHPDGNIIVDNVTNHENLTLLLNRQIGIFIANGTHDSEITNNEASGGKYGIFNAGESQTQSQAVPGKCSIETEKYCLAGVINLDCAADEGNCQGQKSIPVDSRNFRNLIGENILPGPYYVGVSGPGNPSGGSAIQVQNNNVDPVVRGNTITGDLGSNSIPVGIGLTGKALETSTVERNTVSGATAGLSLIQSQNGTAVQTASIFGAAVRLNDFTGNGTNVKSTRNQPTGNIPPLPLQPYTLATELSVDDQGNVCGPTGSNCQGNYWGHTCLESDGFIEFGLAGADSDDADTVDNHAYGESVALQDPVTANICPGP